MTNTDAILAASQELQDAHEKAESLRRSIDSARNLLTAREKEYREAQERVKEAETKLNNVVKGVQEEPLMTSRVREL